MRSLIPFLYILFVFSCGPSQSDTVKATTPVKDTVDIFLDTVRSIAKHSKELTIKEVEDLLHEYFGRIELTVIPQKGLTEKLNIYAVTLMGELPSALHKEYTFIDVIDKHLQFLLPVEFNQLYEIEDRIMIGGIYASREYEYYSIYELGRYSLNRVFDTNKAGGERIVIGYFKDDECIDYDPDRLLFRYNEQTNDILFTGNAGRYCMEGRDRVKNDKIIERISLKLIFHYKKGMWELDKKRSHYFSW
jgi:hypothetical protein